jgi:hypothetical protein
MLPARRTRTWLLALAALATLGGCRGPMPADELVLVPRAADPEPGALPRWELVLTEGAGERGAELWLPLPSADAFQRIQTLAVEVSPPGAYELTTTEGGDRVVHVTAGAATLRALVERTRIDADVALPVAVADLPATLDATAWVDAATTRGVTARVAHGVERTSDGHTVTCRWPEALIGEAWLPVDIAARRCALSSGRVRLPLDLLRAVVDGAPAQPQSTITLTAR